MTTASVSQRWSICGKAIATEDGPSHRRTAGPATVWAILSAAVIGLCGCRQLSSTLPMSPTPVTGQPNPAQQEFASAEMAARALVQAAMKTNSDAVARIFGPAAQQELFVGNPNEDRRGLEQFAKHAGEHWSVEAQTDRKSIIVVGTRDWPFPVPIVQTAGGKWFFDTVAGKAEILARRIGRDELAAISECMAFVRAEQEYASEVRDNSGVLKYAQRYWSTPGKKDGLYWETTPGEAQSPAGPAATVKGHPEAMTSSGIRTYRGYVYRILTRQGPAAPGGRYDYVINGNMIAGFALVAAPIAYDASGIMTFIINHQGILYEKDLGPDTQAITARMTEYNPDSTWQRVSE